VNAFFPLRSLLSRPAAFLRMGLFWAAILLLGPVAQAQGTLKEKFGDWQLRCDKVPDKATGKDGEQCILLQSLVDDQAMIDGQKSEINLVVVVLKATDPKASNARKPILRVIAPLGILLPRGLGLKVDSDVIGATGFVRCLPNGCVAEVELDDGLIDKLKKGKEAVFVIFLPPDDGRGLPLVLDGFEKGFQLLQ